ncbi:cell division control protein 42 homolog [Ruditapes philippinarum]|uniref:cell division control protein 42 homolog n=1 Tax=Ruditapes philippinarum TaxID=129788 RepID=UPI00295B3D9F|nr:cell division control protein 42 homolog [Ruditapes philippinarum]
MSKKDDENRFIKCVLVGDACVGKTCMLKTYTTNIYPTDVYPGGWDNYTVTVTIGETSYQLGLFDTSGLDDYCRLRALTYPGTHVFLLCYSVINPDSMDDLLQRWVPEVQHFLPSSAFLIVGTQTDLRDDESTRRELQKYRQKPVTHEEGAELAKQVNADGYVECSSLTQQGLNDVFDEAILAVLSSKIKRRAPRRGLRKCVIL